MKNRGVLTLEFLGAARLYEPGGLLYKDEESLKELIKAVVCLGKPVVLSRLNAESKEVSLLGSSDKKKSICILREDDACPFLPITTQWPEFESSLSSRNRYDLRRARKKADALGKVEFEIVSPTPTTLKAHLQLFSQIEAASWKGSTGTAIAKDEAMQSFFYLYGEEAARLGILSLGFLKINDQPVAALLGIEYFNRYWTFKIGYDEAFAQCSPGILIMHEMIRNAFEKKLEAFEFLGTDAPWIHLWTKEQHPYVTARVYPFSFSGQLSRGIDATIAIAHNAFRLSGK